MLLSPGQSVLIPYTLRSESGGAMQKDVVAGALTFTSLSPSIATVTDNGDGLIEVTAVGPTGRAVIAATNDHADDLTLDFQGSMTIDVVPEDVFAITFGIGPAVPARPRPEPEPNPHKPSGPVFPEA